MKTLPLDYSRCSGRTGFTIDGPQWCEHKDTCQRYLAFSKWDDKAGITNYRGISVFMAMQDCRHKIEVEDVS